MFLPRRGPQVGVVGHDAGHLDWSVSVDSTINQAHQQCTNLPCGAGGLSNFMNLALERVDYAVGRSRGGLRTKIYHQCDVKSHPIVLLLGPVRALPSHTDRGGRRLSGSGLSEWSTRSKTGAECQAAWMCDRITEPAHSPSRHRNAWTISR